MVGGPSPTFVRGAALIGLLATVAGVAFLVLATPAQAVVITSTGPLTSIEIGDGTSANMPLSCEVHIQGGAVSEFFGDYACGTYVFLNGQKYWPGGVPAGTGACSGTCTAWAITSTTGPTGAGTVASPYKVVQSGTMGTVAWTETDKYVTGNWYYTTYFNMTNNGVTPATGILWRAADCYLAASDSGYGWVDTVNIGGIACTQSPTASSGALIEWIPHTAGSNYYETGYSTVWSAIGSNTAFTSTCTCATLQDNGAGLSWSFTIPAGGTVSFEQDTLFSNNGISPAVAPTCAPGTVSIGLGINQMFTAGAGTGTFSWSAPGASPAAGTGTTFTTHYNAAGSYTITVTSGSLTATCSVTVWPPNAPPIGTATQSTPGTCLNSLHTFTSTSSDPGADGTGGTTGFVTQLQWNFGDGSPLVTGTPAAVGSVTHQYTVGSSATPVLLTATLRITDNAGLFITIPIPVSAIGNEDCCPTITARPLIVVYEGDLVAFPVDGVDPEGLPLTFGATDMPSGATLSGAAFGWQTDMGDRGDYLVQLFSRDAAGCNSKPYLQRIRVLALPSQVADHDQDGISDEQDNCPDNFNTNQQDTDHDGLGDACASDIVRGSGSSRPLEGLGGSGSATGSPTSPTSGPIDGTAVDTDKDGLADDQDNCIDIANALQLDGDKDNVGDACDQDADGDLIPDVRDACVEAKESSFFDTAGCKTTGGASSGAGAAGSSNCASCVGGLEGAKAPTSSARTSFPITGLAIAAGVACLGALVAAVLVRRWG